MNTPRVPEWLRNASDSTNINTLVSMCHTAANRIDALERDLVNAQIAALLVKTPEVKALTWRERFAKWWSK